MANILNPEDENDQSQEGQNANVSQIGGLSGGNSTPSTPVNNAPQPKGSGRFTNIQKYLGANQGAGEDLAGGIRNKSDEYNDKIREGINSAAQVQQGVQDEQNRINQAGTFANQIQNDSVSAAANNLDDITKLRLGQSDANKLYGQGLQTASNIQQNLDPLNQMGQNLGSEGGRFKVLQDVFGGAYKPQYNMGQRRLDQTLLQSQGGNQLNDLQRNIGQSVTQGQESLSGLNSTLGKGINDLRYGTQDARNIILDSIGSFDNGQRGALGTLYSNFETEQAAREQELQNYLDQARAQFGTGTLSQNTADLLGYTGSDNVYDLNLRDYANSNINIGDSDVTMADVLGRGDLDPRLSALSQLAGTSRDSYDLGTAEGQDILFDVDKFKSDAANQAKYENITDEYEDNFFDRGIENALRQYYYDKNPNESREFLDEHFGLNNPSGRTVYDEILDSSNQGYVPGSTFSARGQYDMTEDETSREMLEAALQGSQNAANAGWIGSDPAKFQQLLNLFDKQRNRNFGIGDVPDDLETGGNFNVT